MFRVDIEDRKYGRIIEFGEGDAWFKGYWDYIVGNSQHSDVIVRVYIYPYFSHYNVKNARFFKEEDMTEIDVYEIVDGELTTTKVKIPKLWLENEEEYTKYISERLYQEGYQEAYKEAVEEIDKWEKGKLYLMVHEMNKTKLGQAYLRYGITKFEKDGVVYNLLVLQEYKTTRGNTTLTFILYEGDIPKEITLAIHKAYMGLIIGKGGSNIRNIQQKYGIKINLQAQG